MTIWILIDFSLCRFLLRIYPYLPFAISTPLNFEIVRLARAQIENNDFCIFCLLISLSILPRSTAPLPRRISPIV